MAPGPGPGPAQRKLGICDGELESSFLKAVLSTETPPPLIRAPTGTAFLPGVELSGAVVGAGNSVWSWARCGGCVAWAGGGASHGGRRRSSGGGHDSEARFSFQIDA